MTTDVATKGVEAPSKWTLKVDLDGDIRRLKDWPVAQPTVGALEDAVSSLFDLADGRTVCLEFCSEGQRRILDESSLEEALELAVPRGVLSFAAFVLEDEWYTLTSRSMGSVERGYVFVEGMDDVGDVASVEGSPLAHSSPTQEGGDETVPASTIDIDPAVPGSSPSPAADEGAGASSAVQPACFAEVLKPEDRLPGPPAPAAFVAPPVLDEAKVQQSRQVSPLLEPTGGCETAAASAGGEQEQDKQQSPPPQQQIAQQLAQLLQPSQPSQPRRRARINAAEARQSESPLPLGQRSVSSRSTGVEAFPLASAAQTSGNYSRKEWADLDAPGARASRKEGLVQDEAAAHRELALTRPSEGAPDQLRMRTVSEPWIGSDVSKSQVRVADQEDLIGWCEQQPGPEARQRRQPVKRLVDAVASSAFGVSLATSLALARLSAVPSANNGGQPRSGSARRGAGGGRRFTQ